MLGITFAVHLLAVCRMNRFWDVAAAFYDNRYYLGIASVIRNWHFAGATVWHFWGFPYAIAATSKLFAIQGLTPSSNSLRGVFC